MRYRPLKMIYVCLVAALVANVFSGCGKSPLPLNPREESREIYESYDQQIKSGAGFVSVCKNDRLELWIDGSTAEIKVVDRSSGAEWFSNPQDRVEYGSSAVMLSQLDIEYNHNDIAKLFNSYTHSVSLGQVTYEKNENGVRVNYLFGEKPAVYTVPQILSVKRFAELEAKLDEYDRETLNNYYKLTSLKDMDKESKALVLEKFPSLKKQDAYITQLRTVMDENDPTKPFASDYLMGILQRLFASAGYTDADLEKDNAEHQMDMVRPLDFSVGISIEYSIEAGIFSANIPNDSILLDEELIKLTKLTLLPCFGAASKQKNGYMFVPDGPGALIDLNNGKTQTPSYIQRLYGPDFAVPVGDTNDFDPGWSYMPVFGLKTEKEAFLAVIEKGDAVAQINASVSNESNAYNMVRTTFLTNSTQYPRTRSLNAKYNLFYQESIVTCDFKINYLFLYGGDANYTGMALRYQRYLLDHQLIQQRPMSDEAPLYIRTIGAVDHMKSIAGIPVQAPLPLTTYAQAQEIMEKLQQNGVDHLVLRMDAWCNNGVFSTVNNRVNYLGELGGKKGFDRLISFAGEHRIEVYPSANFQYVPKHTGFSGFNQNTQASRTLENVVANNASDDILSNVFNAMSKNWAVVSPAHYGGLINRFLKDYSKTGVKNLDVHWMGEDLNGDYRTGNMIDRERAKNIVADHLVQLEKQGYSIGVSGANFYTLAAASFVTGTPTASSRLYICDRDVPFLQIVLHGIVPHASWPLNAQSDYEFEVLKLIETGTIPQFRWIYENNSVLKETSYNYYSVSYETWLERAVLLYKELNSALAGCYRSTIASHSELQRDVYKTVFSNGTEIYVNYTSNEVAIGDLRIKARSYAVKGALLQGG